MLSQKEVVEKIETPDSLNPQTFSYGVQSKTQNLTFHSYLENLSLEHQSSNSERTSPTTPLCFKEGSLAPPSLVGKGPGRLGF